MTIPTSPLTTITNTQLVAALGVIVGSAAGDALGAPFEFRPAGEYLAAFPRPVLGGHGEMIGGGAFGWAKGEFTDDTQMALALAESLLAQDNHFDPETTWNHFVAWTTGATDIGTVTSAALRGRNWRTAAREAHERLGRSAGNGSVMRIAPVGVAGVRWGAARTIEVAREQSALTHFDPACGWGAAVVAELIRRLIVVADERLEPAVAFARALDGLLDALGPEATAIYEALTAADWHPDLAEHGNGTAWVCTAQAIWAVRTTSSFEDAVVAAVNLGDDADTVAAVTGAIAGALYGLQRIPSRWSTYLHGSVAHPDGTMRHYTNVDLQHIAHGLVGSPMRPQWATEPGSGPARVHDDGVYAANLQGAADADTDMAVVSLCRTLELFDEHPHRREVYLIDQAQDRNPALHQVVTDAVEAIDAFLAEGREVVVHCWGGRSRTGLILKAWYMRRHGVDHATAHEWLEGAWHLYDTWNDRFIDFLNNEWSHS